MNKKNQRIRNILSILVLKIDLDLHLTPTIIKKWMKKIILGIFDNEKQENWGWDGDKGKSRHDQSQMILEQLLILHKFCTIFALQLKMLWASHKWCIQWLHMEAFLFLFSLQRLRTENSLLRQKMDSLEQESSDLADRLIQVKFAATLQCWFLLHSVTLEPVKYTHCTRRK